MFFSALSRRRFARLEAALELDRWLLAVRQPEEILRGALPLAKAVDQTGRDWTAELATVDHRHAVPRRIEAREREGHAEVVVKVTLGGGDAARCATEEERQQVLGGGLACAA